MRTRPQYRTSKDLVDALSLELRLKARIVTLAQHITLNDFFGEWNNQSKRWLRRVMRLIAFYGEWQYRRGWRDAKGGRE